LLTSITPLRFGKGLCGFKNEHYHGGTKKDTKRSTLTHLSIPCDLVTIVTHHACSSGRGLTEAGFMDSQWKTKGIGHGWMSSEGFQPFAVEKHLERKTELTSTSLSDPRICLVIRPLLLVGEEDRLGGL
jgi:hypothetical protein